MCKYTFLLPAYKAKYLDEMLKSIQSQTYTDFKVLISDDCSPEDIHSVCKPYLHDNRFKYRRNETNIGGENLIAHWNLLVDLCDTEYVIMASDDDIYAPTFLEEIDKLVEEYPYCNLFRSRVKLIDSEGDVLRYDGIFKEYVSQIEFTAQCHNNFTIHCMANYVFKTANLQSFGGFYPFPLAWFSDLATPLLMARSGCANTTECLFCFRHSGINLSCSTNSHDIAFQKVNAILQYDLWLRNFIQDIPVEGKYEKELMNFVKSQFTRDIPLLIGCDIASCSMRNFFKTLRQMRTQGYSRDHYFNYFKRKLFKLTHK